MSTLPRPYMSSVAAIFLVATVQSYPAHAAVECAEDICVPSSEAPQDAPATEFRVATHQTGDLALLQARVCDTCQSCLLCETGVDTEDGRSAYGINLVLTTRAVLSQLGDRFDSVVLWHDFVEPSNLGAAAYYMRLYVPPRNGLNIQSMDNRAVFGSSRLAGLVNMRDSHVTRCPACEYLSGLDSGMFSVVAQEVGHEWSSYVLWSPPDSRFSARSLLGRVNAHWSWYADTFGSPLEGNHWVPSGPDTFDAIPSREIRYSDLDQYLMGLRPPEAVAPFRLIHPSGEGALPPQMSPMREQHRVEGDAVWVTMDSILEANGPREPPFERAVKVANQLWVYLFPEGEPPQPELLERVQAIRSTWPEVYHRATDGRGRAIATLDGTEEHPAWEFTTDADLDRPGAHVGWRSEGGSGLLEAGAWAVDGIEPRLRHDRLRFHAEAHRTLELDLAVPQGARGPVGIRWRRSGEADLREVEIQPVADGISRTYVRRMPESDWTGLITELEIVLPELPRDVSGARALVGAVRFVDSAPEDADGDGVADESDACADTPDPEQRDLDRDGMGDACDDDRDGDGSGNPKDNCPDVHNLGQSDSDVDAVGNACDESPYPPEPLE